MIKIVNPVDEHVSIEKISSSQVKKIRGDNGKNIT
jgi:hypothetical protein